MQRVEGAPRVAPHPHLFKPTLNPLRAGECCADVGGQRADARAEPVTYRPGAIVCQPFAPTAATAANRAPLLPKIVDALRAEEHDALRAVVRDREIPLPA